MSGYLREEMGDAIIVMRAFAEAVANDDTSQAERAEMVWPWLRKAMEDGTASERASMAVLALANYLIFKLAEASNQPNSAVIDHLYLTMLAAEDG